MATTEMKWNPELLGRLLVAKRSDTFQQPKVALGVMRTITPNPIGWDEWRKWIGGAK